MNTDRELLELAAKAIGNPKLIFNGAIWCNCERMNVADARGNRYPSEWNPLTDDGDALRLAAQLRLLVKPGKHLGDGCTVETQRSGIAGCTAFYEDPAQQMRQAIVHAAAEIGRKMP